MFFIRFVWMFFVVLGQCNFVLSGKESAGSSAKPVSASGPEDVDGEDDVAGGVFITEVNVRRLFPKDKLTITIPSPTASDVSSQSLLTGSTGLLESPYAEYDSDGDKILGYVLNCFDSDSEAEETPKNELAVLSPRPEVVLVPIVMSSEALQICAQKIRVTLIRFYQGLESFAREVGRLEELGVARKPDKILGLDALYTLLCNRYKVFYDQAVAFGLCCRMVGAGKMEYADGVLYRVFFGFCERCRTRRYSLGLKCLFKACDMQLQPLPDYVFESEEENARLLYLQRESSFYQHVLARLIATMQEITAPDKCAVKSHRGVLQIVAASGAGDVMKSVA